MNYLNIIKFLNSLILFLSVQGGILPYDPYKDPFLPCKTGIEEDWTSML